jgi:hypothetical protein
LRRTADTYIKAHLTAAAKKPEPVKAVEAVKAPDAVDFFTNPTESVAKLIENHPALKHLQGVAKQQAAREISQHRASSEREFNRLHPDASEILSDEGFRQWVVKSPIRKAMLLRAHEHYDLNAANEVFDTWKELRSARAEKQEGKPPVKPVAKKEAARVPSGGNATPVEAASEKGQKIYRRADVIRLMEQDPDRYALMADEITQAYVDGRVR